MNTSSNLPSIPKKLIYIAGPFWHDKPERRAMHVSQARLLGVRVAEAGFMLVIPHSNTAGFETLSDLPESFYHAGDILLLSRCDAVLLATGWENSQGTLAEISYCRQHTIPVYHSIEELLDGEE